MTALAEETEVHKCPVAKGLYGFCCTYRFVASVYLQADVLPHLARLSRIFQKETVNFLAIKEQVLLTSHNCKAVQLNSRLFNQCCPISAKNCWGLCNCLYQVPVTMACLKNIKDAGDAQPPGSFLAQLHIDLDNPAGLGAFNIVDEEERERRGRGQVKPTREVLWSRYRTQVHLFWLAAK